SVTIPYAPEFTRRRDDGTWLWSGASLAALVSAAARKGMSLVGCNSFGNNAFFVREELRPDWLPALTSEEGFVRGRFKESMIVAGTEKFASPEEEQALLE